MESGWYIANRYAPHEIDNVVQPKKKSRVEAVEAPADKFEIHAWGPIADLAPEKLHVPYWARSKNDGVKARPLLERLLDHQAKVNVTAADHNIKKKTPRTSCMRWSGRSRSSRRS